MSDYINNYSDDAAEAHTLLLFRVGRQTFACEFSDIIKIEPTEGTEITPAPGFPEYMPGTTRLESGIAPVIDSALRFGTARGIFGLHSCYILTGLDVSGKDKERFGLYDRCAVMVDEVFGSDTVTEIQPPPAINSESYTRYMKGVYSKDGETIYIISPDKMVGD